jgi:uncharacterized protein YjdB
MEVPAMARLRVLSLCIALILLLVCILPCPTYVSSYALAESSSTVQQMQEESAGSNEAGPTQEPTNSPAPEQSSDPGEAAVSDMPSPTETVIPVSTESPPPTATPTAEPETTPSAEPETTPSLEPEATPGSLENASEGYAAVLTDETPILEKANKNSAVIAYLCKNSVVYISDRIKKDADNPGYDWVFCHFDSVSGIVEGYMRLNQLRFLTGEETQEFLSSPDLKEDHAAYEGHPLARIDCIFPNETSTIQPELTKEPQNTPASDMETTEQPLSDAASVPPVAESPETPAPDPEQDTVPTEEPAVEPLSMLAPVSSIALDAAEISMAAGTRRSIRASVEPADTAGLIIHWTSSDESVLLVDETGTVTAVSAGSAVITAAANGLSGIFAQCAVTVFPPVTSLEVTGKARMQVGKTYPLAAMDRQTPIASSLLTWSCSDETVATVDASVAVTGIMAGYAVLTAAVTGSPELTFDFPVEIIRATTVTMADSNKQFSMAVSQNNKEKQNKGKSARAFSYSEFNLMRLLLKTDGTIPVVDEYNPDIIIGSKNKRFVIQFTSVEETEAAYNVLKNAGYVKYVEPDRIMSVADQVTTESSYTYHSWGASAMHADTASEGLALAAGGSLSVAIIDTGISAHSFLSGKRLAAYDYVDNDTDPSDANGHGTHVAGTVVDLTQALNVRVVAYRVLDSAGYGYDSDIIDAIHDAADAGCSVINLSLGGDYSPSGYTAYNDAVSYATGKGTVVVCAAGNESGNTSSYIPACLTVPGCIVTASVDSSLGRSYFSNYGSSVDVAAPGSGISSCRYTGGFVSMSGTSMAAPHISAACAMIKLSHPGYGPSQIEAYLKDLCTDLGSAGKDSYYGYGIPDLSALAPSSTEAPKPDLAPTQITFSESLAAGQSTYFDSGVTNAGGADSGVFAVKWEVNSIQMGYGQHGSVSSNTTVMDGNSSFSWTPDSPGNYVIQFTVDCDNTVNEEDETNNSFTVNVTVPEPVKPDLTVLYIAYDKNVSIGKQINFVPFVSNNGGPSDGFAFKWEVNGELKDYRLHSGISANTGVSDTGSQFSWTPAAPGNYTIAFTVDCDNTITEENESNNTVTVTVLVPEPAMPDLAPLAITYGTDITAGQQILFDTGIANYGNAAANAFAVKWEVNGEQKGYGTHDGISAFATVLSGSSQLYFTPSSPGYYTVTFTVDCDNSISEKNESNNQASVTVYVNPVPPPQPQSIAISHASLTLSVGQGVGVLSASVLPAESNTAVTWLSMNNAVATVSASGYVVGTGIGSTVIRARTVNGLYKDCTISVVKSGKGVTGISLSKSSAAIDEGKTLKLSIRLKPSSPANKTVVWSSSNPSVAWVNNKGTVYCSAPGTAVITATASSGIIAQCTVTVRSLAVSQVILKKSYLEVDEGKSTSLTASVLPKNARIKTVAWTSSDPSVAAVSPRGKITTYKPGTVQITATAHNGVSASCTLKVRSLAVTAITLNKTVLTLRPRKTYTLKAALMPRNARYKAVTWVSSDPNIATVSAKGTVRAVGSGTAVITAIAHNGLSASCTVVVP